MATVTLVNKTPVKLAAAKSIMFVGTTGLYFGFGSTTPTEWYSAEQHLEYYTIAADFGDVWVKYDLDAAGSPTSKIIKYQLGA